MKDNSLPATPWTPARSVAVPEALWSVLLPPDIEERILDSAADEDEVRRDHDADMRADETRERHED